jgi:hypothetical protein
MNPLIQPKKATPLFLIALPFICFTLSPTARAQLPPPPPDGGYPGFNTAEGQNALFNLTTGIENTAVGYLALSADTTGISNTATGAAALQNNTDGGLNTATGVAALFMNTHGFRNTATGEETLFKNTGAQNTATGAAALFNNTTANNNTADGFQALLSNTTGTQNTGIGESAFKNNTTANNNTGVGFQVAFHNTTGPSNTAIGYHALLNNSTGSNNIALGANAGVNLTTGNNNIEIGTVGGGGESNTIRIGSAQTRAFMKGISGVAVSGAAVVVNAAGQLGVAASSERFKDEIKAMGEASEAILSLNPVTFHYKKEIDAEGTPQFGLVAEEVEKVNPALVLPDKEGKPYTVRYDAVNAMLLNEFLKEHRKVQELESTLVRQEASAAKQQAAIAAQQKQIETLTAVVQKVSAQLELSKAAPQTVLNNQ